MIWYMIYDIYDDITLQSNLMLCNVPEPSQTEPSRAKKSEVQQKVKWIQLKWYFIMHTAAVTKNLFSDSLILKRGK